MPEPVSSKPSVSILTGEPFRQPAPAGHPYKRAAAAAVAAHALVVLTLVLGFGRLPEPNPSQIRVPTTLVFRVQTGSGGGGGGGGEGAGEPPSRLKTAGDDVTTRAANTKAPEPLVYQPEPEARAPARKPREAPPGIEAPLAARAPDSATQRGVLEDGETPEASSGPGTGQGAGSGVGRGSGPGQGSGLGEGTGDGFGAGAYRLGSGVTPPSIVRRVEPAYTEDALKRKIQGEVVLRVVILEDGRVGDVRVVQGLDRGLDQNAIAAARKWRFTPGRFQGQPVAVIVDLVMEFRIL